MIAGIVISSATYAMDKPYSYRVPEGMLLAPGQRVTVPFGRGNIRTEGIVLSLTEGDETNLKCVEKPLEDAPLLTEYQLRMAAFLRERYFCTFYDAVRAILPPNFWFQEKQTVSLTEDTGWKTAAIRKEGALAMLKAIEAMGGKCSASSLSGPFPEEEKRKEILSYLVRKKWVQAEKEYLQKGGEKTERIALLAVPGEEAMAFAATRPKSALAQKRVLELMAGVGSASVKDICYYTGAGVATVNRLEKLGYLEFQQRQVLRCREIKPAQVQKPLVLNEEQMACFEGLQGQMERENPGVALLYGVTGSGKTSVYIRLIQETLEKGRAAVLLVPEIALTPQLLGLMAAWFGERVAVLHSSLPSGERFDQWERVRSGEAAVVVGTRSAVFAPCPNLGLIILDEEQEHSYKSENAPRYCAKETAIWRGVKEKALVLLGSATPSVETMYRARQGEYSLYRLTKRFNGQPLPEVEVVDMRQELKLGNAYSLSYPLRQAIHDTCAAEKQTILLLNRRGNSRALVCVDCREAPECPRCSSRLTYHSANGRLMCHYCGFSQPVPNRCPKCGGPMKPIGIGTQKVQQELAELFPDVSVARMDADTVSAANPHEAILDRFRQGQEQILLGTQMVAKGLDLPNVTLVGAVDADLSLYTGSFRAGEDTFHILTQVVGRAGRGQFAGRAVIQTMVPGHAIIRLAAKQDYDGFYDLEIQLRQMQHFPPFGDCVTVAFQGEQEHQVLLGATKFRDSLLGMLAEKSWNLGKITCLGPAPSPIPKVNYHYRYRLTLGCKLTREVRAALAFLLRSFGKDSKMRGVTAFIDINGFD